MILLFSPFIACSCTIRMTGPCRSMIVHYFPICFYFVLAHQTRLVIPSRSFNSLVYLLWTFELHLKLSLPLSSRLALWYTLFMLSGDLKCTKSTGGGHAYTCHHLNFSPQDSNAHTTSPVLIQDATLASRKRVEFCNIKNETVPSH